VVTQARVVHLRVSNHLTRMMRVLPSFLCTRSGKKFWIHFVNLGLILLNDLAVESPNSSTTLSIDFNSPTIRSITSSPPLQSYRVPREGKCLLLPTKSSVREESTLSALRHRHSHDVPKAGSSHHIPPQTRVEVKHNSSKTRRKKGLHNIAQAKQEIVSV
jgi:hypothetical protein